jgi:hypothetical protein
MIKLDVFNSRQPASIGRLKTILVRPAAILRFSRLAFLTVIVPDEVPAAPIWKLGFGAEGQQLSAWCQNSVLVKI